MYTYVITVYEDDRKFIVPIQLFHKAKPKKIVTIEGDNKLAIV